MARADPLKSLKQVYKDFITEELPPEAAEDVLLPTFTGCKSQMHRTRQEDLPKLPQSAAEVQLAGEYAQTSTGDNFVLQQTDQPVILATDENLRVMAKCETLLMEGTFKAAPNLYNQLFTIHGIYKDRCLPLLYCLLPDKSQATYYAVIDEVKRKMLQLDLVLNPSKLMSDFESGLLPALRAHFPKCSNQRVLFSPHQGYLEQGTGTGTRDSIQLHPYC